MDRREFLKGSRVIDFPDFTRGAWKTLPRFDIYAADIAAMDLRT